MTLAQAKQLAGDLLGMGVQVQVIPRGSDTFAVKASAISGQVDLATFAPLLSKYTISAPLSEVTFL